MKTTVGKRPILVDRLAMEGLLFLLADLAVQDLRGEGSMEEVLTELERAYALAPGRLVTAYAVGQVAYMRAVEPHLVGKRGRA